MSIKKNFLVMILIIIAAIIVLAGVYCLALTSAWLSRSSQSDTIRPNIMLGGDRDAHGCIGSAGYSWCEAKQRCFRAWEEKCEIGNNSQTLPIGYTLDTYKIAEVSSIFCQKDTECVTPGKYLIMSSCPYTSLCLKNKCTVVCPSYKQQTAIPSDWQTYRNEKLGFELRYPKELQVIPGNNYVRFNKDCSSLKNDELGVQMRCSLESDMSFAITNETINEFIEGYKGDFMDGVPLSRIVSQEDYVLDNTPGKKLVGNNAEGIGGGYFIYAIKNGKNYLISYGVDEVSNYQTQVISTFKFIK